MCVDLSRVVRQGVRAGVESYSIKRLEPLCGYVRQMDLRSATENLIAFEAALEDGTARGAEETKQVVAAYNEDDCRPGAAASALEHILGDHLTMPPDAGLLLDQTRRMHPRLCRYTSETFYDGKLTYADGLGHQEILGDGALRGSGLRVVKVAHEGNTNASPEEAAAVARLVHDLVGASGRTRTGYGGLLVWMRCSS